MLNLSRNWPTKLYCVGSCVFLAIDLFRSLYLHQREFMHGPFGLPSALILVGLRAVADLFVLAGLYELLAYVLSGLRWDMWRSNDRSGVPENTPTFQPVHKTNSHDRPSHDSLWSSKTINPQPKGEALCPMHRPSAR